MAIKFLNSVAVDTNVLYVDAASNRVGIGTTSPSRKLDIEHGGWDGLEIKTTSSNGSGINLINSQRNFALYSRSDSFHIRDITDSDKPRFVIRSTGNTGIGTDSPNAKLDINGDVLIKSGEYLSWGTAGQTAIEGSTTSNKLNFLTNGSSQMFLNSTGLGIGTTSPSAKLEVNGGIKLADNSPLTWSTSSTRIFGQSGYMQFQVAGADSMRLTSAGKVGIGLISPLAKLHVRSAFAGSFTYDTSADDFIVESNANGGLTIATASANTGRIIFASPNDPTGAELSYNSSGSLMKIGTTGANGILALQSGNGVEAMRLTAAGDVGVGVTVPRAKLDVNGGVKVAADTDTPSANKAGTLRYRYAPSIPKSQSMVDMCMQTGPSTYAWVNIVTNTWSN